MLEAALAASTADHCLAIARVGSTANVRWANNTLTTNGVATTSQLTVVSVVDGVTRAAAGVLTRGATAVAQARELVAEADAAARAAGPSEDSAPLVDGPEAADFDTEPGVSSLDALGQLSGALGDAFRRADSDGHLLYGYAEHDVTTTYLASSTGLRSRHEQPTAQLGITAKPSDLSTSAWVGAAREDFGDIDIAALTDELRRRVAWGRRTVELPAGRYETLLPPTAVADLMLYAYYVMSGRDAHEGRTVFSDLAHGTRVGQQVAAPSVRLHSDPHLLSIAAQPFVTAAASTSSQSVFDNGAPVDAVDWISGGVLRSLCTSRHTAALTGLDFTPRVDNLRLAVAGGGGDIEDMVAASDRALLLTCLWYIREVDPQTLLLTGLTRDGVYLVEGGEVVGAVNNFRFNESPIDLLNRFTEAGVTERSYSREWGDLMPRTATPALRVPDFNMSSVSQAS